MGSITRSKGRFATVITLVLALVVALAAPALAYDQHASKNWYNSPYCDTNVAESWRSGYYAYAHSDEGSPWNCSSSRVRMRYLDHSTHNMTIAGWYYDYSTYADANVARSNVEWIDYTEHSVYSGYYASTLLDY